MRSRGLLSIDEGTSSTRASVVLEDGRAGEVFAAPITTRSPDDVRIEQDAAEIWSTTLGVVRAALAWAAEHRVDVRGATICTQRATLIAWDRVSGEPLAPAVSWQDRRYTAELRSYAAQWDDYLLPRTGRPVGARCAFLWLARATRDVPAIRAAFEAGRLLFGTVDTWLVWKLTGGATHAISTTNAVALGGYDLRQATWDGTWLDAVGCPRELAPTILDDDGDFGYTDDRVIGVALPITAVLGDQHSALIAFGATDAGAASCVHGTGTFAGAIIGAQPDTAPQSVDNVLTLVGWRSRGVSTFSLEAHAATTGAALRWLCEDLQLFASPAQIAELAATESMRPGPWFVPALGGIRTPVHRPQATGTLAGLSLSTTRAQVARAALDGIAHTVCDLFDGLHTALPDRTDSVRTGGGLATSDVLMSAQADLLGVPVERVGDFATASLRGAAYLGGVRLGMWESIETVARAQGAGEWFEPAIGPDERASLRKAWATVITAQVDPESGSQSDFTRCVNEGAE